MLRPTAIDSAVGSGAIPVANQGRPVACRPVPEPTMIRRADRAHRALRLCCRPACGAPARATLTYHYRRGVAWLDALTAERDPHGYDLCHRHADGLSVPHGWRFDDRRPVASNALVG
jgi:hypothetical protein